jgi:hypothetical protein
MPTDAYSVSSQRASCFLQSVIEGMRGGQFKGGAPGEGGVSLETQIGPWPADGHFCASWGIVGVSILAIFKPAVNFEKFGLGRGGSRRLPVPPVGPPEPRRLSAVSLHETTPELCKSRFLNHASSTCLISGGARTHINKS